MTRPWTPPPPLRPSDPSRVRGALAGSLLYDQPRHAAARARVEAFVGRPGPLSVEVGFDHGTRLIEHARRDPDALWLGFEIREFRVLRLLPVAPSNCLPFRGDARTAFAGLLPPGRVSRVDVWFPDPVWMEAHRPRYLLFSPAFRTLLERVLHPGGALHVATDIPGYFEYIAALFAEWPAAEPPTALFALSRRERVCARDGLPVYRGSWARPATPPSP